MKSNNIILKSITSLVSKIIPFANNAKNLGKHLSKEELESEFTRIQALLDKTQKQTKIAYWEYVPSTQETTWSDYAYQLLGHEPHQIEPSNESFEKLIHPEDIEQFQVVRKQLAKEDALEGCEFRIIADGKIKHLKMTGVREVDDKGHVTRIIGTVQDITKLKLNEIRLHNINHFASALMNLNSKHDLVWYVAKEVVSELDLEDCVIYLLDKNTNTLVQSAAYGLKNTDEENISNKIHIKIGEGITGHVAETMTPLIVNDVSKDERYINDLPNMGSEICVPIIHENELYGVIDCEHSAVNFFTENHLDLLSTIATLLASKLGQWHYTEKIQASETQYKDAQRIAHFGSWSLDFETNSIQWSDEIYRILGVKPHEIEANPAEFKKAIHPDDWEVVAKSIEAARLGEKNYEIGFRVVRPNGEIRFVHAQGEVFFDQSGIPLKMSGSMMDVTVRKSAEKSLRISQQRLILHRELSPLAIIEWNPNFEVVAWNPAAEKIFGFSSEEVMGKIILDLIVTDSAQIVVDDAWKALLENAGGGYTVNENLTKDKRIILCEWNNTALADENGNVIGVTSIVADITERHKIEESLRISQQRWLLHREQSPVGVVEWNRGFEFLDWNPAAEKIFGFTIDEVLGKNITERILPESARPTVDKIWQELLENKGGIHSINENITKDGRTILCEWHNTSLIDDDGNVIGVTSLVEDITERQKQVEDERQEQKMEAIGNLTGGIAHDFNNMLGVILGFSELIKKRIGNEDPKLIKYCDQVLNAGERAKKLTSQLLEFSRKAPSVAETTHINKLLESMKYMLEKTLTPRINLVFEPGENLWPIWLDRTRLEDAIFNISINAMHAMLDSGTLTLRTYNKHLSQSDLGDINITPEDYVVLSIKDTGCGMTDEIQQKIFEPFFTTKGTEGTGLGLSQVYGFVQQSGGHIQVSSEQGLGTTITLYFPRHHQSIEVRPDGNITDTIVFTPEGESILVVDDEVALLDLTEEILASYGYTIFRATNTEQALEVLKEQTVDLMISDVIMPGRDGYQLAAEVKKHYPKIKIQMISGYTDDHDMNFSDKELHKNRLHKPLKSEALLMRVRELLKT